MNFFEKLKKLFRSSHNQRASRKVTQRKHLLGVTVRREVRNAQIIGRIVRVTLRLTMWAVVLGGLGYGGWHGWKRLVVENPDYALAEIEYHTDGQLPRPEVVAATGIKLGTNYFRLDIERARLAVDKMPTVDRAEVRKEWPNRVVIQLSERQPVAWIVEKSTDNPAADGEARMVDARGRVLKMRQLLEVYRGLPVISGINPQNYQEGQEIRTFEMRAALEIIRLNSDTTRFHARHLDVGKGYCVVVSDRNHAQVTFGLDGVEQQFDKLNRLLDDCERIQRPLQSVNLFVKRNTPVVLGDTEPVETQNEDTSLEPVPPKLINKDDKDKKDAKPETKSSTKPPEKSSEKPRKSEPSSSSKPKETKAQPATKRSGDLEKKPFKL